MPAQQQSLRVTSTYRQRLAGIQERLARDVAGIWDAIDPDDLAGTYDAARAARLIEAAQRRSAQTSSGYLTAFLSSELDRRVAAATVAVVSGETPAGRPLGDATFGVILGVKQRIGQDATPAEALGAGRVELLRLADVAADRAARQTLTAGLVEDDRFTGWRRAVRGTCGACLGAASGRLSSPDEEIDTHPGCQCVQEPQVRGAVQRFHRPSGAAIFAAYSVARQNALFGEEKAQLVRDGEYELADLIDHSPIEHGPDILTERPLDALKRRSATE